MEYRKATIGDAPGLVDLMEDLGYSHTQESISDNLRSVERNGGSVFVALCEGVIVGCICAIIDARLAAGECGELVSVVVSAKYRGKGIGRGLISHAEQWLSTKTRKIRIRANVVRNEAHGFYTNLGYTEEKSQKIFMKNV